jgi:segregation and condensation protein B
VEEAGHEAETTATLYRTTSYFLERIGVTSVEDLPELAPFLPDMSEMADLEDLDGAGDTQEQA